MSNNNGLKYFAQGQTFYVDGAIKGQSATALYDPLRQAAYLPALRKDANGATSITMPYADMGFEGFFSEMQMEMIGSASREVKSSDFFWAEYLSLESLAFAIAGDSASPANSKTTKVSRFAQTRNGVFATPHKGWDAVIVGQGRPSGQLVTITDVVKNSNGDFDITITGKNGETIDLSKKSVYKLTMIPMTPYTKGTDSAIQKSGYTYNPPMLQKSWVQKYEDGVGLHEDEIDGYIYDRQWEIVKGVDSDGKPVDYIYVPAITKKLVERIAANRTLRLLVDKRDYANGKGMNGLIPTTEDFGQFNYAYDDLMVGSFKSILFSMIKSLRKVSGSPTNYMLHDFNYGIDFGEAMANLVQSTSKNVNVNYELFGGGGVGTRDLTYFQFNNFQWNNYNFIGKQINAFDTYRLGQLLTHFALLLPAKRFTDISGNTVPIVTVCHQVGAEPAKTQYTWVDDARVRGLRTMDFYAKDNFGIECHGSTRLGMIYKPESGL